MKNGCSFEMWPARFKEENMPEAPSAAETAQIAKKWKNKRGSLIMALHELQNKNGYVPREAALQLAEGMGVPLARIYEVLTFYHYFKMEAPGRYIISVCMGTACYLKGAEAVVKEFEKELGIPTGTSTPDKMFHLQSVRCIGCCVLAPVITINGKIYPRLTPADIRKIIQELRDRYAAETKPADA